MNIAQARELLETLSARGQIRPVSMTCRADTISGTCDQPLYLVSSSAYRYLHEMNFTFAGVPREAAKRMAAERVEHDSDVYFCKLGHITDPLRYEE